MGHVVITHLHYDHTGYLSSFPAAQFVLQEAEMAFWTGRHAGRGEFKRFLCEASDLAFLVEANVEGRVRQLTGDREIMPGISVHLVGGHTPGLQIVRVRTAGGWVVLGSDAAHYRENLEADRPFAIVHTLPLMYDAFDRLQELAGPDGVIVAPVTTQRCSSSFRPALPTAAVPSSTRSRDHRQEPKTGGQPERYRPPT